MSDLKKRNVVIVLGMHRSGTSALSEFITTMGYKVPGELLDADSVVNERGFWESKQIVDFNEKILSLLESRWFFLASIKFDKDLSAECDKMALWLNSELDRVGELVVKDPRINILLPVWLDIFEKVDANIIYLNVHRSVDSIVKSLSQRDGFSVDTCYGLWWKYTSQLFKWLDQKECYFVAYEEAIRRESVLEDISRFLCGDPNAGNFDVLQRSLSRQSSVFNYSSKIAINSRNAYIELKKLQGLHLISSEIIDSDLFRQLIIDDYYAAIIDDINLSYSESRIAMIKNGDAYTEAISTISQKDRELSDIRRKFDSFDGEVDKLLDFLKSFLGEGLFDIVFGGMGECKDRLLNGGAEFEACLKKVFAVLVGAISDFHIGYNKYFNETDSLKEFNLLSVDGALLEFLNILSMSDKLLEVVSLLKNDLEVAYQGALQNEAYIHRCHERIDELERVVREKEVGEEHNKRYIDQCHQRIVELENALGNVALEHSIATESLNGYCRLVENLSCQMASVENAFISQSKLLANSSELNKNLNRFLRRIVEHSVFAGESNVLAAAEGLFDQLKYDNLNLKSDLDEVSCQLHSLDCYNKEVKYILQRLFSLPLVGSINKRIIKNSGVL